MQLSIYVGVPLTRNFRHLAEIKKSDPNRYHDILKSLVDLEPDLLSERQKILASPEVFEDSVTGERKSNVEDIARSMAGMLVSPSTGKPLGYRNSATSRDILRGKYKAEISIPNPAASGLGAPYMRVKNVDRWAGDAAAAAFVDPENVDLSNVSTKLKKAAAMGKATSTGDGRAMLAANQRYTFTDNEVDQFLKLTTINGKGLTSFVQDSGLDEGRKREVIDPVTLEKVIDLDKGSQKVFYKERAHNLIKDWLQSGGRALNDLEDELSIPGNAYQMEHNSPFSVSNALGQSETPNNRVGFYERHVNSEKGDIETSEYYRMQRLAYLANKAGIPVSGVKKGDSTEDSLNKMMLKANPPVIFGDKRRKDAKDVTYPERVQINDALIQQALFV